MQNRHVELRPQVLLDLALEAVEHGVAKRAGRHHGLGAIGLGRLNVLAGQLDGDPFVVCRGMEAAVFGAAAVIDRLTAEDFGEPLQRDVVARVDELVALRWTGDVAAVERRDGPSGEWPSYQGAQPALADVLVQHPEEMADLGAAAVMQAFVGKPYIDRGGEVGIVDKPGVSIEY